MKLGREGAIFVAGVVAVVSVLAVGSWAYLPNAPPSPTSGTLVGQLEVHTAIRGFTFLGSTGYSWSTSVINRAETPVVGINATLDMSRVAWANVSSSYRLDHFAIQQEMQPQAIGLVRNAPPPFVGRTNPLFPNETASNGMLLFRPPPYLSASLAFPTEVRVAYANGTVFVATLLTRVAPAGG